MKTAHRQPSYSFKGFFRFTLFKTLNGKIAYPVKDVRPWHKILLTAHSPQDQIKSAPAPEKQTQKRDTLLLDKAVTITG